MKNLGWCVWLGATLAGLSFVGGCTAGGETETVVRRPPTPKPPAELKITRASYRVPDGKEVRGGGPLSGDDAAVARIAAQFPAISADYTYSDKQALAYLPTLQRVVPLPQISAIATVSSCAVNYGVVGARVYVAKDLSRAGATVVVSRGRSQQLPNIAARCLADKIIGDVRGGGAGGLDPCFSKYTIDSVVNGVQDHYYVFTAGTNKDWCGFMETYHDSYNRQPL